MGYFDSCYLVNRLIKKTNYDKRQQNAVRLELDHAKQIQESYKSTLEDRYEHNASDITSAYDAQISTLLAEQGECVNDPIKYQNFQTKIDNLRRQKENALNQLKSMKNNTANQYQAQLGRKETQLELAQNYWDQEYDMDSKWLAAAKADKDKFLKDLFPGGG